MIEIDIYRETLKHAAAFVDVTAMNYVLRDAEAAAGRGNYTEVRRLLAEIDASLEAAGKVQQ